MPGSTKTRWQGNLWKRITKILASGWFCHPFSSFLCFSFETEHKAEFFFLFIFFLPVSIHYLSHPPISLFLSLSLPPPFLSFSLLSSFPLLSSPLSFPLPPFLLTFSHLPDWSLWDLNAEFEVERAPHTPLFEGAGESSTTTSLALPIKGLGAIPEELLGELEEAGEGKAGGRGAMGLWPELEGAPRLEEVRVEEREGRIFFVMRSEERRRAWERGEFLGEVLERRKE